MYYLNINEAPLKDMVETNWYQPRGIYEFSPFHTWINFTPSMDKLLHPSWIEVWDEIVYLSKTSTKQLFKFGFG